MKPENIKEALIYNPDNGKFYWGITPSSKKTKGEEAGHIDCGGYIVIQYKYKYYKAHRLAWYFIYGEWPRKQIDHINGNRKDNRIINLRLVTPRENSQNRQRHRDGKLPGIIYRERLNKWEARIGKGSKYQKSLGVYNTREKAYQAYLDAQKEYEHV